MIEYFFDSEPNDNETFGTDLPLQTNLLLHLLRF